MSFAVETVNLCKEYGNGNNVSKILRGINLTIEEAKFVSIMGPSGSGKSTLLYLIGGIDTITSGQVKIFGEDIKNMNDDKKSILRRREISFIFQFYNLIPTLSVIENVMLPLALDNKKLKDYKEKAEELLEIVGLEDRIKYMPAELSGGQQQRVAIARALINDPKIILADEPIGNLDSKSGIDVLELLKKINEEKKKTIVMVTHSTESSEYANMRINLKDGKIS
ncbi:ABC transporter ATP-binding protein [Sedimentibacter sp. zth1]|uniref:ABC transporter ATP-binding protein n=1 Tax=Sedimentibacter sp. zth1 TaxID=2816908 RepID=UPI001A910E79|nr:ABC transporter ATP-binding protein [Sedimentibacter sp. zth1]QSX05653.1 ABC transporter ATP-binding protein [Sedimentibacter sp. zth1]